MEYKECEKMKAVSEQSQQIGEFLEWLSDKGIKLCKWKEAEREPVYYPAHYWEAPESFEKLLAEYFSIDLKKVEEEKRAMLTELRKAA